MKIDCTIVLKNLSGVELKDGECTLTLGRALSNILISTKEGGKMKLFTLATDLFKKDAIEIDSSDLALIKNAVRNCEIYNALVSGQCEQLLEEIK